MKKVIIVLIVATIAMSCKKDIKNQVETSDAKEVKTESTGGVLLVDAENSQVNWKGFKPTGEHYGTIAISEGTINIADGSLAGGAFTFDMNSIMESERNAKLEGHLKSADFFEVEKFPTATFEITEVMEVQGAVKVSGNLTVKGIARNITIPVIFDEADGVSTLTSKVFSVDRTEFGIQFKSTKLVDVIKEKSIDDLFEMSFKVQTMN